MENLQLTPIGAAHVEEQGFYIEVSPEYRAALTGLEGFSHIQVLWWFSGCDDAGARSMRMEQRPYHQGPECLGVFATRSPHRPNPIALSCARVLGLDLANGVIRLAYFDAADQSPVLDLKPYTPSVDRVEAPEVPAWCAHWPKNVEESGDFDWEAELQVESA